MSGRTYIYTYLLILQVTALSVKAQFYNLPSEYSFSRPTEKTLAQKDSAIHSGIKPYIHFYSPKYSFSENSLSDSLKSKRISRWLFNKHFIEVKVPDEKFKLRIDPLINIEAGRDLEDSMSTNLYTNSRGLIVSGYIGDKFYFETLFSENQSMFPAYIASEANASQVVPGQGRWKTFKTKGYDYAFSSGFVSIQAFKNINIQVGHGKQKIGHGYRSLLLSDNAFNYPYARITQQWFKGRLQYTNIYAVLMNLTSASVRINPNTERLFQKKAAAFQYLSLNLGKSFNVGLFQGMVWKAGDSRNRHRLDWQYFNPVIFTNLASYGLHHENNILVGADAKVKITNKLNLYGQVMIDHLASTTIVATPLGYQLGINYFDALTIKNLYLQIEYNDVPQLSYLSPHTAQSSSDQSYSHYNQLLAYTPINGSELLFVANYKYKRFFIDLRYHLQSRLVNVISDYTVQLFNGRCGIVLNPAYNLNISLGVLSRSQNFNTFNSSNNETNYIYVGLRTSIYNLYYDF